MIYKKYILTTAVISNVLLSSFLYNASASKPIDALPTELLAEIFGNLELNDLVRVQSVSREFERASKEACDKKKAILSEKIALIKEFCALEALAYFEEPERIVELAQKLLSLEQIPKINKEDLLIAKAKAYCFLFYHTSEEHYKEDFFKIYTENYDNEKIKGKLVGLAGSMRN